MLGEFTVNNFQSSINSPFYLSLYKKINGKKSFPSPTPTRSIVTNYTIIILLTTYKHRSDHDPIQTNFFYAYIN